MELVIFCLVLSHLTSLILILLQEEVLSDRYKRIIFYNITAKPVRHEFTLTHVFKGQFNMLNLFKR